MVHLGNNENHKQTNKGIPSPRIEPALALTQEYSSEGIGKRSPISLSDSTASMSPLRVFYPDVTHSVRSHQMEEVDVIYLLQHYSTNFKAKSRWNGRFGRADENVPAVGHVVLPKEPGQEGQPRSQDHPCNPATLNE